MSAAVARIQSTALRASGELNAFVAWWLHELRDTWLAASERLAPARSQRFVIDLSESRGALRRAGRTSSDTSIEFICDSSGELPSLQRIWPQDAPTGMQATVLLPESSVLTCELRLPPVAERDIDRAVDLQLERELPLPRDQLYIDWRIRAILPDRFRVVDIVAARRTTVNRVRESVRAWGWQPIAVSRKEADDRLHFNLLPAPTRRLSFDIGKRERYLAWSAVALLFAYLAAAAGKSWLEKESVHEDLTQARTQMTRIDKQRALLASESKPIVLLREVMAQPAAPDGLIAISSALPRDTWIYQADIRAQPGGVSMRLEGYTPSATSLLQGLEGSGRLESVELIEATSAGLASGSERVELQARMHGRSTP